MNNDGANNLAFYDSAVSANDYLEHPITGGEARMCAGLRAGRGPLLEVGCGAGRLFDLLADADGGWVGVDYAAAPLRIFAERRPGARLIRADATALPFKSNSFGAALLGYHMIESILPSDLRRQALAEVARVVAPDGAVVLTRHLRRSYHPFAQLVTFATRQVAEFGDLVGPARSTGLKGFGSEFRMHVLSEREVAGLTKVVGLERAERWDYTTGGHMTPRSVAVVERYVFGGGDSA